MQKIYLKLDDDTEPVTCDFGFVVPIIFLGFIYPLVKHNYKMSFIMLIVQVAISVLIMCFIPFKVGIIITILMILLINILFAANYNMIVIEGYLNKQYVPLDYNSSNLLIKKGIYFKLN